MTYMDCISECERIQNMAKMYHAKIRSVKEQVKNNIVSFKYGNGGLALHRGYYCPSLIVDIISNADRGILATEKNHKKTSFHYGLDKNGNLIYSKQGCEEEYILRADDCEFGITPKGNKGIRRIAEYKKDSSGKPQIYSVFRFDDTGKYAVEFEMERYEYSSDLMTVERVHFINRLDEPILLQEMYSFVVEKGQLIRYSVEDIDLSMSPDNLMPKMNFDVLVQRFIE